MRGVASVALALAVPLTVDGGGSFPERDAILFIAFAVVLVTLVCQGLTLPWLAGRLGVRTDSALERELERQLAVRCTKAARRRLREIEDFEDLSDDISEALARRASDIGIRISPDALEEERHEGHTRRIRRLKRIHHLQNELLSAARHEVLAARNEPGIDPEVVDRVLRHLDARSFRG
jgi:CPA1 family monovalent cation:H+ antiporter